MPTLRIPRFGSRVITIGQRDVAAPVLGPGREERELVEVDLHRRAAPPPGTAASAPACAAGTSPTSGSLGSMASLPKRPSGTFRSSSSVMPPADGRPGRSTPSARHIRRMEPKRLMATGWRAPLPSSSSTCSKSSAGPPPGLFMQRSAISAISRRARTGCDDAHQLARGSMAWRNVPEVVASATDYTLVPTCSASHPAQEQPVAHVRNPAHSRRCASSAGAGNVRVDSGSQV